MSLGRPHLRIPASPWSIMIAVAVWGVAAAGGMAALWRYESIPGRSAVAQSGWPSSIPLSRAADRPTLVMFVHPRCACSRASLGELDILMARHQDTLAAKIVFVYSAGPAENPSTTDLWSTARQIPGVTVLRDDNGALAKAFHAETSGQVFLYNPAGDLLFSGGVTTARGHFGDSDGLAAIDSLVADRFSRRVITPVFGCSLR